MGMAELPERVSFWPCCRVSLVSLPPAPICSLCTQIQLTAGVSSSPEFCLVSPVVLCPFLHTQGTSFLTLCSLHCHFIFHTWASVLACHMQWETAQVHTIQGWCVLCMPSVQVCCKNVSLLALFLSYSNGLLPGFLVDGFFCCGAPVLVVQWQNHCFQEQALSSVCVQGSVSAVMPCSWYSEGPGRPHVQPCAIVAGKPFWFGAAVAGRALGLVLSGAVSRWGLWNFHGWAQQELVRVFGLAGELLWCNVLSKHGCTHCFFPSPLTLDKLIKATLMFLPHTRDAQDPLQGAGARNSGKTPAL